MAIPFAVISFAILPVIFLYPFHADIDILQVMGFQLARYHGLPYIGSWDSNFPGTVFIHAASILLFGNSEFGLRLTDLLFQICIVLVLYRIGRYWLDRGPALLGSILYALFYTWGPGQYISQRDCFAALPILFSIWLTIAAFRSQTSRSRALQLAGAGIFAGLATWIRPTFGLLIAAPFLSLFDLRSSEGWKALFYEMLGFGLTIVVGLLPYAFTPGTLYTFYLVCIRYNFEVYSHAFGIDSYSRRAWVAVAFIAVWALAVLYHKRSGTISRYKPKCREEIWYIAAVIISLLAGVAIMRRLASYHFAPFFVCFMPILAAVLWEAIDHVFKKRALPVIAAVLICLYPWRFVLSSLSSSQYSVSSMIQYAESDAGVAEGIASYVVRRTRISDPVELASITSPGPRWRIERPFATRFTTILTLITALPDGTFTPYQQEWQREYVDSLRSKEPKFYIVDNPTVPRNEPTTLDLLYKLPGLKQWLLEGYRSDTTIGNYVLFGHVSKP